MSGLKNTFSSSYVILSYAFFDSLLLFLIVLMSRTNSTKKIIMIVTRNSDIPRFSKRLSEPRRFVPTLSSGPLGSESMPKADEIFVPMSNSSIH